MATKYFYSQFCGKSNEILILVSEDVNYFVYAASVNELFVLNRHFLMKIFLPIKIICVSFKIAFQLWLEFPPPLIVSCWFFQSEKLFFGGSSHVTMTKHFWIRWRFSSTIRFNEDVLTRNRCFRDRYLNPHYRSFPQKRGNNSKHFTKFYIQWMSEFRTSLDFRQFSCVPFPDSLDFRHFHLSEILTLKSLNRT